MVSAGLHMTAFAALALTAASSTFLLLFTVTSMMNEWTSTIRRLSLAATVLSFVDLAWISTLLLSYPRGSLASRHQSTTWVVFASLLVPVGAASSAIAALVLIQIHPIDGHQAGFGNQLAALLRAEFVLWSASVLAQIAFFILLVRLALRVVHRPPGSRSTTTIATGTLKPDLSPRKAAQPATPTRNPSSPTSPRRPADDFCLRGASQTSMEARRLEDVVDARPELSSTRTSSGQSIPQPVTPPQRQRLEPIPGSRSNSPARPLDGPFPGIAFNESPIHSPPLSQMAGSPDQPPGETRVPPRFRKDSSSGQQTSMIVDESHIHPLFRTDNPLPPPTPTVGTSVIASAFGGQYISARSISRASSRSRPTTPTDVASPENGRDQIRANSQTQPLGRSVNRTGSPTKLKARSMEAIGKPWTGEDAENIPPLPENPLFSSERLSYDLPT